MALSVARGRSENLFDIGPVLPEPAGERGRGGRVSPAGRPAGGQQVRATAAPARLDAAGRCLAVGTTWARFAVGIPDEVFKPPKLDVRNVAGVIVAAATITACAATGPGQVHRDASLTIYI
ncbi:MAG TPA: hypothetical protein VMF87_29925 [Streptosporangiaceae bacterium]|nr:hypothetical protein [Streptosporangiaceae bacterium]